jgi:hypothetical protein
MAAMKKNDSLSNSDNSRRWKRRELGILILYAIAFYFIVIRRSLHISRGNQKFHYHVTNSNISFYLLQNVYDYGFHKLPDHHSRLYGLRPGWLTKFTHLPNVPSLCPSLFFFFYFFFFQSHI